LKTKSAALCLTALAFLFTGPLPVRAQQSEIDQLKSRMQVMERTLGEMKQKIAELERQKAGAPAPSTNALENSRSIKDMEKVAEGGTLGEQSPVPYQRNLNDQQEAAARPKDYTMDTKYLGFIPIPNTPALIKFNAKPRVDVISDSKYAGNSDRFVPALFPLSQAANYGGGEQFNINANGSQLRLDLRAPSIPGDFRFYYQNNFFGAANQAMKYSLQHFYSQYYGFLAGYTYSVWTDPDVFPDTVDLEGPNAIAFGRRAVAHYTFMLNDAWNATFGVEAPKAQVDGSSVPGGISATRSVMPDLGYNLRWEKRGFGHVQFSSLYRNIGARDATGVDRSVFGWGVNLGAGLELTKRDSVQLQWMYGNGIGSLGNDTGWLESDAAYRSDGVLEALPYWSGMVGLTHRWSPNWRSTFTYGYVDLHNSSGQLGTFYHCSHYASANLVLQLHKHLSIGMEGLYGTAGAKNGDTSGDVFRLQLGLVYSLFD
jgi:hypothetical protein